MHMAYLSEALLHDFGRKQFFLYLWSNFLDLLHFAHLPRGIFTCGVIWGITCGVIFFYLWGDCLNKTLVEAQIWTPLKKIFWYHCSTLEPRYHDHWLCHHHPQDPQETQHSQHPQQYATIPFSTSTGKNSTRWPDCSWNLGKHCKRWNSWALMQTNMMMVMISRTTTIKIVLRTIRWLWQQRRLFRQKYRRCVGWGLRTSLLLKVPGLGDDEDELALICQTLGSRFPTMWHIPRH